MEMTVVYERAERQRGLWLPFNHPTSTAWILIVSEEMNTIEKVSMSVRGDRRQFPNSLD